MRIYFGGSMAAEMKTNKLEYAVGYLFVVK